MDAAAGHRARSVPIARQRRRLAGARWPRVALLRRPLRRDVVHLAHPGKDLARQRRHVVRRVHAARRRGDDGAQSSDRSARRRLSAAHLPRDRQRHRGRRRREHVALPPLSEGLRTVEADRRHPVEEGQHPAGRRRGLARALDRLLPPRRRLRTDHRWLDGPRRVHRRRLDLERGTRLHVPEPERGGGFPEAGERQPAAGVQRQHDEANAARRRAVDRRRCDLRTPPDTSPKVREISRTRLCSRAPMAASTPSTRRTGGR